MNKDLDERLVPNGEYRDAMNIQVKTSDGGEAGTVQNILGNSLTTNAGLLANELSENAKAVGSVVDEKNDAMYFLIASPNPVIDGSTTISTTKIYKDIILEQRSNGTVVPVAVDIHTITETYAQASSPTPKFLESLIISSITPLVICAGPNADVTFVFLFESIPANPNLGVWFLHSYFDIPSYS